MLQQLNNIDNKTKLLQTYVPTNPYSRKSVDDQIRLLYTFNSNGIEGNTLTLAETKIVVEERRGVAGKSLREINEATNHNDAINKLIFNIDNKQRLNIASILEYNSLVLKNIDDEWRGRFRNGDLAISGAKNRLTSYHKVYDEMKNLEQYIAHGEESHPIIKASKIHLEFVKTHPFFDGNGRTARLITNHHLLECGYPLSVIENADRLLYINSIEDYCLTGNTNDFVKLVAKSVESSLDLYIEVLELKVKNQISQDRCR